MTLQKSRKAEKIWQERSVRLGNSVYCDLWTERYFEVQFLYVWKGKLSACIYCSNSSLQVPILFSLHICWLYIIMGQNWMYRWTVIHHSCMVCHRTIFVSCTMSWFSTVVYIVFPDAYRGKTSVATLLSAFVLLLNLVVIYM